LAAKSRLKRSTTQKIFAPLRLRAFALKKLFFNIKKRQDTPPDEA
jgi:hypothetical protein